MVSFLGALFMLFGFLLALKIFKLIDKSKEVLSLSRMAHSDIRNPAMTDDEKEIALQSHARRLFVLFFIITIGLFSGLFVPFGLLWGAEQFGLIAVGEVIDVALSWQFLVGSTVALIIVFKIISAKAGKS